MKTILLLFSVFITESLSEYSISDKITIGWTCDELKQQQTEFKNEYG